MLATSVHAGVTTLVAQVRDGTNGVAELSIGPYEVAELVSAVNGGCSAAKLEIIKDGATLQFGAFVANPGPLPLVVAGPATVRLTIVHSVSVACGSEVALCSLRTTPEPFPPDRTVIALPGTNQTSITLECSTNLVDWASATNGVYGPMPEAKFFRIKLQR